MEYKYLKSKQKTNSDINVNGYDPKYQRLLDNLLSLKATQDPAIFTKTSKTNNNDDLTSLLSEQDLQTIYTQPSFKIPLKFHKPDAKSSEMLIWIRKIRAINELFIQTGMWPYFIGTYFLRVKVATRVLYAPLLLKEVEIVNENNTIYLQSRDSYVHLNEKLSFLIEQGLDMVFPILNTDVEEASLQQVSEELDLYLANVISNIHEEYHPLAKFVDQSKSDINNNAIEKEDGIVLLNAQPIGGPLREALLNLIKTGAINSVLNVSPDVVFNSNRIAMEGVVETRKPIARICQTDASQEKAILSSLNNHTIIIGPPGTGKSQTIANLIANIMLQNKTALVISQKRVALEVVLERMKSLQHFVLRLMESGSGTNSANNKKDFYQALNNFINTLKDTNDQDTPIRLKPIPLVSNEQEDYWKTKQKAENVSQNAINEFCKIKNFIPQLSPALLNSFATQYKALENLNCANEIDYILSTNNNFSVDEYAVQHNEKKKGFLFWKKYDQLVIQKYNTLINFKNVCANQQLDAKQVSELIKNNNLWSDWEMIDTCYQDIHTTVPSTNKFIDDEREIKKYLTSVYKQKLQRIYAKNPSQIKKFLGNIEVGRALPFKLINKYKDIFKDLFSVVVSTPEALASFVDFEKDHYDYVIFDEASQLFVEKAIPFIAIADKAIIAGDDQQMQPSNWFGVRSETGLENDYDIENVDSLLTFAVGNSLPKQMLQLNYRSDFASLTTFSSKEFYKSELKSVDNERARDHKEQPIEVIEVNGRWEDNTNTEEAEEMIRLLSENIDKYHRIILLTLNMAQMQKVDYLLSSTRMDLYQQILDGRVILKNLENIQGDEADLVIVSIGYTKNALLAATYVGSTNNGGRNALNVAITRAKKKMIVLKSISSTEVNLGNSGNPNLLTFKKWLEFLELSPDEQKTYALTEESDISEQEFDSGFESDVYQWLLQQSFPKDLMIKTQYPIGSYRIDLALLDRNTKKFLLGIEVDGWKYHSSPNQRYNDLVRENFIKAKGYDLVRIPELIWKTNKNDVYQLINRALMRK